MKNEIKILLMSDMHLGKADEEMGIPDYVRINTFKKIIAIAKDHDLFLISGDLFDNINVNEDIIDMVKTEFKKVRDSGTDIIFTPGEREISVSGSLPSFILDLNINYVFSNIMNTTPYLYSKEGHKILIYGIPASSGFDISSIKKIDEKGLHVGLFHVNFDFGNNENNSFVYKLQKNELRTLSLDFYAFGHFHNFKMFKVIDKIIGVCPGSPESVTFNEQGDRYVISITVVDSQVSQIRRLSVNSMKLLENSIDCSGIITMGPIKEALENNKSKKVIFRLNLFGKRDFVLNSHELQKYKKDYQKLEIIDNSIPTIDTLIEEYQYENSLRGEFYKVLKEKIDRGDVPDEIDQKDLAQSLNRFTRSGFHDLEDWLCKL